MTLTVIFSLLKVKIAPILWFYCINDLLKTAEGAKQLQIIIKQFPQISASGNS